MMSNFKELQTKLLVYFSVNPLIYKQKIVQTINT